MIVAEGRQGYAGVDREIRLQWGRNMIVAEGVLAIFCSCRVLVLQWGRNMIVAEGVESRALLVLA